jgi:hypothetical protein
MRDTDGAGRACTSSGIASSERRAAPIGAGGTESSATATKQKKMKKKTKKKHGVSHGDKDTQKGTQKHT